MTVQPPIISYQTQARGDSVEPAVSKKIASAILWAIAAIAFLAVGTGCAAVFLPGIFIVGAPIVAVLFLVTFATALRRIRTQRAMMVLSYLEQATRLNLPLAALLDSAARSESGALRRCLREMHQYLLSGYTVAAALGAAVPELSRDILSDIGAGEQAGRLPQTLHRVLEQRRRDYTTAPDQAIFYRFYPIFMFLFGGLALTFMLVFVIPKFQEIFKDFRVTLPWITQWVIDAGYFMVYGPGVFFLTIVAVGVTLLLITIVAGMLRKSFQRRTHRGLMVPVIDIVRWYAPLYGTIVREAEIARVCAFLAECLIQQMTLAAALLHAEALPKYAPMRRKLNTFRFALMGGASLGRASHAAGMPVAMCGLLASAEATSSVPEALEFLARHYRWRTDRRAALLVSIAQPASVLLASLMVAVIVIAMFLPLVKLIESVEGSI